MKKAKRSFELEENELDYSKDLGIELDDDEIIDLEDVVEIPEESDEDDLSLDVELLDVDSDLDLSDLDSKLKGSGTEDILDDEFLKEFSFGDAADEKAEEPAPKQQPEEDVDILGQGSVDELLKEFSFPDEETGFDLKAPSKTGFSGGDSSGGRLEAVVDNEVFLEPQRAASPPAAEEPKSVEPAVAVAAAAVGVGAGSVGMSGAAGAGLDDLITQLENRLVETIRQMVESRLPDIVRTVLREEIEKLKREL